MEFKFIDNSKTPPEAVFSPDAGRWFGLGLNTRRKLMDFAGRALRIPIREEDVGKLSDGNRETMQKYIEEGSLIPGFYTVPRGSIILGEVAGRTVSVQTLDGEVSEIPHITVE